MGRCVVTAYARLPRVIFSGSVEFTRLRSLTNTVSVIASILSAGRSDNQSIRCGLVPKPTQTQEFVQLLHLVKPFAGVNVFTSDRIQQRHWGAANYHDNCSFIVIGALGSHYDYRDGGSRVHGLVFSGYSARTRKPEKHSMYPLLIDRRQTQCMSIDS